MLENYKIWNLSVFFSYLLFSSKTKICKKILFFLAQTPPNGPKLTIIIKYIFFLHNNPFKTKI